MPASDKYTDPELRDEVKEEVQAGDKGGAPGQWSARKAQMMASEYKKRGGGYTTDKKDKDESQKNLDKWGEEDWQTKEGSGNAKQEDGSQKRYLPKKAWEEMTEEEKKETDEKKLKEGDGGKKQFVENTDKAKEARSKATKGGEEENGAEDDGGTENEKGTGARKGATEADGGAEPADDDDEYDPEGDDPAAADEVAEAEEEDSGPRRSTRKRSTAPTSTGESADKKRKTNDGKAKPASKGKKEADKPASKGGKKAAAKPASKGKSQKPASKGKAGDADEMEEDDEAEETHGSKHDSKTPPEGTEQATKDNFPKKGDQVHWKAMPGWCSGKVDQVLTSTKTIEGKSHKATKDDPRIVIRSDGPSGKLAIHKVDKVYIAAH